MWEYGRHKLHEIGPRGVFTGWGLSLIRESLGYGIFFATYEYCHSQLYYSFLTRYYHFHLQSSQHYSAHDTRVKIIKPHFAVEPVFILFAGIAASVAQQMIQYPLGRIQDLHHSRVQMVDDHHHQHKRASRRGITDQPRSSINRLDYGKTFQQAHLRALRAGSWRAWLFSGFSLQRSVKFRAQAPVSSSLSSSGGATALLLLLLPQKKTLNPSIGMVMTFSSLKFDTFFFFFFSC